MASAALVVVAGEVETIQAPPTLHILLKNLALCGLLRRSFRPDHELVVLQIFCVQIVPVRRYVPVKIVTLRLGLKECHRLARKVHMIGLSLFGIEGAAHESAAVLSALRRAHQCKH